MQTEIAVNIAHLLGLGPTRGLETCLDCAEALLGAAGAKCCCDCPCCSTNPTPDPPGPDEPDLPERGQWTPEHWKRK